MSPTHVPFDPDEAAEKFELFVFEMSDAIEDFREWSSRATDIDPGDLDMTVPSVDLVEDIYTRVLDRDIEPDTDWDTFNTRTARYLGETFRRTVGGKWTLETDERAISYGLPGIGGVPGAVASFIWDPFTVLNNFRGGRKRGLLRSSIEYYVRE